MQHGHVVWTCSMETRSMGMRLGHAESVCSMAKQHEDIDMEPGHAVLAGKMDMPIGNA
jgi:hypothetical protein